MATLNWKHENTNTETLYLENELLGTVVKKQAKDDGNSQYLLTARVENTWWANDDLNAMDMPHAKQIAEMRILKAMKDYRDDYDYKAAQLSHKIESISKCFARFTANAIKFEDIEMDLDGKGVTCQLTGPIMGKLDRIFGLMPEEGVWYNLYACYRHPERMTTLVCTKNTDERSDAFQLEVLGQEYSIIERAILAHIKKEFKYLASQVFNHEARKHMEAVAPNSGDYAIYQLSEMYPEATNRMFCSYKQCYDAGKIPLDLTLYEKVYSGNCEQLCQKNGIYHALEDLYAKFNANLPEDYTARSMSVSDLIVIKKDDTCYGYYCDSFGFEQLWWHK